MSWRIETSGPTVDNELLALPRDNQAAFLRLSERIAAVGLENIGEPHVKHLRGKALGNAAAGPRRHREGDLRDRHRTAHHRAPRVREEVPENAMAGPETRGTEDAGDRSEERRVGKEGVRTSRSRRGQYH